jgi:hypothetical protein
VVLREFLSKRGAGLAYNLMGRLMTLGRIVILPDEEGWSGAIGLEASMGSLKQELEISRQNSKGIEDRRTAQRRF